MPSITPVITVISITITELAGRCVVTTGFVAVPTGSRIIEFCLSALGYHSHGGYAYDGYMATWVAPKIIHTPIVMSASIRW